MRQLTPRQKQILELIQDFIAEYGMPPTRAEISRQLGFKSANAAEQHLRALQKKGVLELLPGASRGIQLKDSLRDQLGLPLIGRVAAGSPILAEEHIETHYKIDQALFNPKPHYLLRVEGRLWWPGLRTKLPSSATGRTAKSSGCYPRMRILSRYGWT